MASASEGDTTLPPLIIERLRITDRLVMLATASGHARMIGRSLSERFGIDLVVMAGIDGGPLEPSRGQDLLVHGIPDVFGRLLDAPVGWDSLFVVERICGPVSVASPWRVDVGEASMHPAARVAEALARLDRHLRQQRRVRPIFTSPPALGLPYVAPEGVTLPGPFGRVDAPDVPGLPDLVVIRPFGDPSTVR